MGEESVESILKFINEGSARIQPSPSRNIIFVLGDSGTGKSMLTHFLASSEGNLVSVKTGSSHKIKILNRANCESTIFSCTVIPELVIDHRANQTYCDSPGNRDTRGPSHDIGSTYFIRKVFEQAKAIKVIFTVAYDSVREGGNRHGFFKLIEYVYRMFKNIKKYEHSVGLVVTKVENIYEEVGDQIKLVPDEVMLQGIIEFLNTAKHDLQVKLETDSPTEKRILFEDTVQLINILINDKDPKNPRIGIFRRPNKAGPIIEMKQFQAGREALQKLVYNELRFTDTDKNDIRYVVSENSTIYLDGIQKKVVSSLYKEVSTIGQELVNWYEEKETALTNVADFLKDLLAARESLNLKHEMPILFIEKLISYLNEINFSLPKEKLLVLNKFVEYLEFIEALTDSTNQFPGMSGSLEPLRNYFIETINWFNFLIDLRVTLSEYSIQHDTGKYLKLIDHFQEQTQPPDLPNKKTFMEQSEQLLSLINDASGRHYKTPTVEDLKAGKLMSFMDVLKVGFEAVSSDCEEEKLAVKGFHIRMTDVVKALEQCDKQTVEIYALNKIFVDVDLVRSGGQVIMVSPEVEIVNSHKIILDGKDAPSYSIYNNSDATPARISGSDGADGLPGLPGGSGGELVTVVQICKNCDLLTITAIGGRGGPGQDGDDGMDGQDGLTPGQLTDFRDHNLWMNTWREDGFDPECSDMNRRRRELITFLAIVAGMAAAAKTVHAIANQNVRIECIVPGLPGQRGGNGGKGGVGGLGGPAGRVSILCEKYFPTNKGPKIIIANGTRGSSGTGGNGGEGGHSGDTLFQTLKIYVNYANSREIENVHYENYTSWAENGIPGNQSINDNGLICPSSLNPIDLSNSLKDFKTYVQMKSNSMIMEPLKKFMNFFKIHERSKRSIIYSPNQLENDPVFHGIGNGLPDFKSGPFITHTAESENSSPGHSFNFDSLNLQSNMLLMDVLIRKLKGYTKGRAQDVKTDEPNNEYSHALAYSAHVP